MPTGTRRRARAPSPPAHAAATDDAPPSTTDAVAPGAVGGRVRRRHPDLASATRPPASGRRRSPTSRGEPGLPRLAAGGDRRRLAGAGPGLAGARETSGHHRPRVPRPGAHHHRPPGAPCSRAAQRARLARGRRRRAVGLPPALLGVARAGRLRRPARGAAAAVQGRVQQVHHRRHATGWPSLGVTKDQASSVGRSIDPSSLVAVIGDAFKRRARRALQLLLRHHRRADDGVRHRRGRAGSGRRAHDPPAPGRRDGQLRPRHPGLHGGRRRLRLHRRGHRRHRAVRHGGARVPSSGPCWPSSPTSSRTSASSSASSRRRSSACSRAAPP